MNLIISKISRDKLFNNQDISYQNPPMNMTRFASKYSITFDKNGHSEIFELKYTSYFNLFNDSKKVTARFRKQNQMIIVDYKFIDTNKWFNAFEANNRLGHYLVLKNNELVIKTLVDFWKIKSIKL